MTAFTGSLQTAVYSEGSRKIDYLCGRRGCREWLGSGFLVRFHLEH